MAIVVNQDLFDFALVQPALRGQRPNSLKIVSGFASHPFASGHVSVLKGNRIAANIDLIYGMAAQNKVSKDDHRGFIDLHNHKEFQYDGVFDCRYVESPLAVHSKVYVWCANGIPVKAFAGSANYTNKGFKNPGQVETLTECDPVSAYEFFKQIKSRSIPCQRAPKTSFVSARRSLQHVIAASSSVIQMESDPKSPFVGLPKIEIDLKNRNGNFGIESGLNWGIGADGLPRLQDKNKPNGGRRDPNEAYIRCPKAFDCGFFPPYIQAPRSKSQAAQIRFTVLTEDNELFTCIRASGGYGKDIQTPQDNSELGRWFRKQLGLSSGAMITPEIMAAQGKDKVVFYKISEDQFFMKF